MVSERKDAVRIGAGGYDDLPVVEDWRETLLFGAKEAERIRRQDEIGVDGDRPAQGMIG